MSVKLSEIARRVNADVAGGPDIDIMGLSGIQEAGEGDITFVANPKYARHLATTPAAAVLVGQGAVFKELAERSSPIRLVKVRDPYQAFRALIDLFYPAPARLAPGIHPRAVVAPTARIGQGAAVGANAVVGERCVVGGGAQIHPNAVLHDDVAVGEETVLYSCVVVREQCTIGRRCIVHAGTVIGADGFGFAPRGDGPYDKIPQRGIVVIEDDVEIGANCTVDRATIGETRIRRGAKLDNLIQVAHNVIIGENTVIAGQSGISGSSKLGNNCVVAGQVGFAGHLDIADRTTFGAKSGVAKSITVPGTTWFGYPAKEHRQALRTEGAIRQLPDLLADLRDMKRRLEEIEKTLSAGGGGAPL